MIGDETGHLLKSVKRKGKIFNISVTKHIMRRNMAATSLKIICKNLYSVKCYDNTNTNAYVLNLQKKSGGALFILASLLTEMHIVLDNTINVHVYSSE